MSGACHVVTGATGGIGAAVVRRLVSEGASVVAVGRDAARLSACYPAGCGVETVVADLLTEEGFRAVTDGVRAKFASVKGFVHCAGFDAVAPLGLIRTERMRELLEIHAVFPVRFLGWWAKKGNHAEGSSGVLISSLAAHEGAKGHVAYAAAKGAVEGILKPAAAELVGRGVRLNALVLGVVETEMAAGWMGRLSQEQVARLREGYPMGLGRPESVADVVSFFLGEQSSWITGQTLVCDGGHSVVC